MRGELLDKSERPGEPGRFMLQNERMLKVDLSGTGGFFYARQGSMVAYQGDVDFSYEGSGGLGKMFKKALTGEGMALMKVSGSGDVFLAQEADEIFVLELEDEAGLSSSVKKTAKLGAAIGRGSGEAYQLALNGSGIVVVQASEGHPAPRS